MLDVWKVKKELVSFLFKIEAISERNISHIAEDQNVSQKGIV